MGKVRNQVAALCRELAIKIEQVGIGVAFRLATLKLIRELRSFARFGKPEQHPFDARFGTDTSGIIEVGKLDISDERMSHAVRYQTAIVEVFLKLIGDLPINHADFVFVDVGSGKGRAILLASSLPFKEVIGIELSRKLHEVACRNIQKYVETSDGVQQCHRVHSICGDAGSYPFPSENLVLYLFNPFDAVVMHEVATNLSASLIERPRCLYILYLKPEHCAIWDNIELLERYMETADYVIFRTRRHPI